MSLSLERFQTSIHRIIPNIINNIIKNERIGYINITEVRVTKDHSFATIFYTIFDDTEENINLVVQEFGRFKGSIKKELASKIKDTRKIPDLIFKHDLSLKNGNKIDQILNNIAK